MPGWQDALSTNAFSIVPDKGYLITFVYELNKKEYKVGEDIIVTIHIVDQYGNPTKNLVYYYPYYNLSVPNATTTMPTGEYGVQFKDWIKIDDYTYQISYKATEVGTDLRVIGISALPKIEPQTWKLGDPFSIVDN